MESPNCERLWINRLVPVLIAKANLVENDRLISVKCRNEIWLQSKKNYMWCRMIRMIFRGRIHGWIHFFRNQFSMLLNSDGLDKSNGGRNFLPLTNSSNPSPAYETKGDISQTRGSSRLEHVFWLTEIIQINRYTPFENLQSRPTVSIQGRGRLLFGKIIQPKHLHFIVVCLIFRDCFRACDSGYAVL